MKPNTSGKCPPDAKGKRVRGRLRNGVLFGFKSLGVGLPEGWAADGKSGCRWTLVDYDYDIAEYEVIK